MKALLKKHESKFRFAFIGGINTAIDFGILFLLTALGLDKLVANFFSTSVAFVFSFFANRTFTFKSTGSAKKQFLPFLAVTLTGLWVLQPLVILAITQLLHAIDQSLALFVAKLIATIVSLIWNYILYSRFVFKKKS
jgi:putative flippase GtrA